ncbi:sigma-70 family RNA polymerase sigma factor [Planctomycetales bacterium ZRK34]|nr:sigma-70 family RNA polymerase sigma factor [Planctomycetales bacterium ZRK34]
MQSSDRQFVQQLLQNQRRIYGFVLAMVADADAADDVYQDACMKLWELADQYDPERPFMPWACGVAFNVVRNHRTKARRDRHLFDEQLLSELAASYHAHETEIEQRRIALAECIGKLAPQQRRALELSYDGQHTMQQAAELMKRPVGAFYKQLQRLRRALAECINRRLTGGIES